MEQRGALCPAQRSRSTRSGIFVFLCVPLCPLWSKKAATHDNVFSADSRMARVTWFRNLANSHVAGSLGAVVRLDKLWSSLLRTPDPVAGVQRVARALRNWDEPQPRMNANERESIEPYWRPFASIRGSLDFHDLRMSEPGSPQDTEGDESRTVARWSAPVSSPTEEVHTVWNLCLPLCSSVASVMEKGTDSS